MTKKNQCTLFEEMLMWTSYRYCIGRKTYVSTMAHEMAQYFYDRLPDMRMEQTVEDIRREIYDKLRFLPFEFHIHRIYNSDPLNPIDGHPECRTIRTGTTSSATRTCGTRCRAELLHPRDKVQPCEGDHATH